MEPNLSLFPITGEKDDSLLQHSPIYDIATLTSAPLSISSSPLSLSSSSSIPTISTKGNADSQANGSVSTYRNKENVNNNENKLGMSNLSVEPQKMKRSKKAGGYNLRKSLAWDRAFFTEEGVLDDSELSLISGTKCDRDSICVADGQEQELLTINSGTDCGSVDGESLEEDRIKNLASDYHPNNRNSSNRSYKKQDSVSGDGSCSISISSQKFSSGHGLKKVVCKGDISPMASTSQKRLSNSGTRKILTRNSKIPKIQVSKKNTSVQSTTTIHSAAGGSSLRSSGIPQPAARKSLSSNLSSNIKHASSSGKASFESTPKSTKRSADVGSDMTNSTLRMRSSMSHKAPHTTKESKSLENTSRQGLMSGVAEVSKSNHGTSNITALSHVHSDNVGLNRKNVQAQGIKPSGLRMPSPSLRFFSETKAPVSNTSSKIHCMPPKVLKPSIPISVSPKVADHNHDSKPTEISEGAPKFNPMGKADAYSQRTYKCSTSSIVTPQVHADAMLDKCNKQIEEIRDPLGGENLDSFEKQYKIQLPASSKVEEKDSKDNVSISSNVEFEEDSYKATIVYHENRIADTSVLDGSCELCPETQLNEVFEMNTEVRSQLSCLEVQLNEVCEMNTEVQSQLSCPEVQLNEVCIMSTEVQSQVLDDSEFNPSVTNNDVTLKSEMNPNSCHNYLMLASNSGPSSSVFDDNETSKESTRCGLDQTKSEQIMEVQLDERSLLADVTTSVKFNEVESAVQFCIGGVTAVQESIISDGITVSCHTNYNVLSQSNYELVEDEECDMMFDSKLSNKKLSQSSGGQDETIENHDEPKRSFIDNSKYGNEDNCTFGLEVGRLSSHCTLNLSGPSDEDPSKYHHFCNSDQGEEVSQSTKHGIVDNHAFADGASTAYELCTEFIEATYTEVDKQHNAGDSIIKQGITNATTSDDVYKLLNSMEDIKDPSDMLSCLPNNDDALQSTHLKFQFPGRSKDQEVIAVADPENGEMLGPVDKHETPTSYELMKAESDRPGCDVSLREPSNNTSQHADDQTDKSTSNAECIKDEGAVTEQRTDDQKLTRPLPDAVPFSDEWLAAIESAGEEILTLKTGAVKHSPPDKSIPEPGPWSPVKRKTNQVIGPFDCTKYTNA